MKFVLPIILALCSFPALAQNQPITGKARIIDGDTVDIAGKRVRLYGIDTPEAEQTCTADGKHYACGRNATFALSQIIGRRGTRIYHMPGGQYYNRTKISQLKGERLFCSEAEARAAGWRRSKR